MCAAQEGQLATLQALLQAGPKLELADAHGWTAMSYALTYSHTTTVDALFKAGANKGYMMAEREDYVRIVCYLE